MEWYWIALIVVAALAVLYTLLCVFVGDKVLQIACTPVAHTLDEARAYQAEHEGMSFEEYDNVWRKENFEVYGVHGKVRGEFVFNPANDARKTKRVAVICHGHTWNRINSVKYGKIFYDNGYDLVLYDHAYFGLSDGKFTTLGFYESRDLDSVLNLVRIRYGNDAFVVLHGESMGAATVLGVLALRNDVGAVVADCPFSNTMAYYREICLSFTHLPGFPVVDFANMMSKSKYGYDFTKYNPIDAVAACQTPVCFIHGKADKFILPHHSRDMYNVSRNPLSELHLVDGAEHARSYLTDNEGYKTMVTNFLAKVEQANNLA